jgi:prevent-host-death family protein
MIITANEIKTKGVSVFNKALEGNNEAIINVRGKNKFVVLSVEKYDEILAKNIDLAYLESVKDIQNNNFKTQNAKEHLQDLVNAL